MNRRTLLDYTKYKNKINLDEVTEAVLIYAKKYPGKTFRAYRLGNKSCAIRYPLEVLRQFGLLSIRSRDPPRSYYVTSLQKLRLFHSIICMKETHETHEEY